MAAWEVTGNHYLGVPCIALEDGSIHALNVLLRAHNALVSWCAESVPVAAGEPLVRVGVSVDGERQALSALAWERLDRWVPRWTAQTASGLRVVCTICVPGGFDPVVRGGVVHVEVENGSGSARDVTVAFEGSWRWSLATVATTRPLSTPNHVSSAGPAQGLAFEMGPPGSSAALGLFAGAGCRTYLTAGDAAPEPVMHAVSESVPNGTRVRYRIEQTVRAEPRRRAAVSLCMAVAPERDGALATAQWLAERGGAELIRLGRLELARVGRSAEGVTRELVGRNAAFHYYSSVARALDDDRLYPLRSRSPEHGACAVFSERAALEWSLPAHALTDAWLARDLLMRVFEQYSDRPGHPQRYIDGGVLAPGFGLGQLCEYVVALERYVDLTRDEGVLDEVLVQQVIRETDEAIFNRLHPDIFLAETERLPSGDRTDYAYPSYDNVLVWRFCRALDRVLRPIEGEPRLRMQRGDDELAAAFWQRCTVGWNGVRVIGGSTDLQGNVAIYDDPAGSVRLLPFLGFCDADDPIWAETMELLHSKHYPLWLGERAHPGLAGRARPPEASFVALCADLLGPRRERAIETLRGLVLPGGVACSTWDPDTGHAASGPWAAAEAGLLVWALLHNPDERKERRSR